MRPSWPKTGLPEKTETIWLIIPKPGIIRIYTSGCYISSNKDRKLGLSLQLILLWVIN